MKKLTPLAAMICGLAALPMNSAAQEPTEEQLDVHTLARVILPAEQAKNIASYSLNPSIVSGARAPSVTLLSRPEKIVPGICKQETYHVDLPLGRGPHPSLIESAIVQWTRLSVADSCDALDPSGRFAQIQPQATDPLHAAQGLSWLKLSVEKSKGAGKQKFSLKCVENFEPTGCAARPEKAFSNLSLKNLFLIKKMSADSWEFVFSEYNPGGPIWKVLIADINGEAPKVVMTKSIPAPF